MTSVQPPRAFGRSVKRKEDRRFITGAGRYTDDVVLSHQAYACFYRAQAVQRDRNATTEDQQAAERDLAMAEQLAPADSTLALRIAAPKFERERLQVGMVAPDIVGKDLDGVEFKLSDYRGKVVVLDFWGDW